MTPGTIIALITQVGLPLATKLIDLYHAGNAPITADQWIALAKLAAYTPEDALTSAGVRIVDNKVVPS